MGNTWFTSDKVSLVEDSVGLEPLLRLEIESGKEEVLLTIKEAEELSNWLWTWHWEWTPSTPHPTPVENLMTYLRQAKEIMTTKNLMPELRNQIDEALKKEASKYGVDV